jgi:inosine-uridine nucleoside N-ribohydrolase
MHTEKVILDTDIGSDIDDAVALAYLLAQTACELLGITTVSGQPVERAKIASALCEAAGKDIPIYPGTENPLLIDQRQPQVPQGAALSRWRHRTDFPQGQAIEFLRSTIRQHPGEITLLTIGPLTNIGLLFALDPEIPELLKGLVMMVGRFTSGVAGYGPAEWNALCDPHAAAMVYRAPVAIHRSHGLDVTTRVRMDAQQVKARFQHPLLQPVLDFAEVWFEEREEITFHDPLAAVSIFEPYIYGYQRGTVDIELASPRLAGVTHWRPDAGGPHDVAVEVDPQRFFDHYFSVFE